MAGDWIKFRTSLPRDPRVVRISSALKADRLRTIGGLASAWCLFDEQTEAGFLDGYTPELLDELVGLPGLSHAMEAVGWLVIGDGFLEVPRFEEHNGQSAKRRAQDSVRKKSAREADKCPQGERTNCGPEKRREEKSLGNKKNAGAGEPCTVEQAKAAAKQAMIPAELGEEWFHNRASTHWTKTGMGGRETIIGETNWRSDLVQWCKAVQAGRNGKPGNPKTQKPAPGPIVQKPFWGDDEPMPEKHF